MKTQHIWFEVMTHPKKKSWRWKPSFLKSNIVFETEGKAWMAPWWEFSWLCFVFHWRGYSHRKEYKSSYPHHECPAELMQERIDELEATVQLLQKQVHDGRDR
jgi:hypothetical protein